MSKQTRRGRGKRPRDEPVPQDLATAHFSATNYPPPRKPTGLSSSENIHGEGIQSPTSERQFNVSQDVVSQPPRGKVAIPALRTSTSFSSPQLFKKGRTPHACDHCRKAKSGCSGDQPCLRCKAAQAICVYGDGKRDKERKRLKKLSKGTHLLNQHNTDICDALRRIQLDMTMSKDEIRLAIDEILAMTAPDLSADVTESTAYVSKPVMPRPDNGDDDGEDEEDDEDTSSDPGLDDEIASHDHQDVIEKKSTDYSQSGMKRIPGPSRTGWTKSPYPFGNNENFTLASLQDRGKVLGTPSYQTDDIDFEHYHKNDIQIFAWPDDDVADQLVAIYFEEVHLTMPLLDRLAFTECYRNFARGSDNLSHEEVIWLSTLNILFAISSFHSYLRNGQGKTQHYDHLLYLERAKILSMDQGLLYEESSISTTCATGMFCLYFIMTCSLNRAWIFCALAIRHAIGLGLNLRSDNHDLRGHSDYRLSLWWSLYSLQCSLNQFTGRPVCISDQDITTPLPVNSVHTHYDHTVIHEMAHKGMEGNQGSAPSQRNQTIFQGDHSINPDLVDNNFSTSLPTIPSTYFSFQVQLSVISHEISRRLYCPPAMDAKWSHVEEIIRRMDQRLLNWQRALPPEFSVNFLMWNELNWNDSVVIAGIGLALQYCSSKLMLYRPCLCHFVERNQYLSNEAGNFSQETREACLKSAREMITLLSAPGTSVEKLHAIPQSWNILHYLCNALSVLLLEAAFISHNSPEQPIYVLEEATKGVQWLGIMSERFISARKAWEIFDRLVRHIAIMVGWSMVDLPVEAPVPPGYINLSTSQYQSVHRSSSTWQHNQPSDFSFNRNFIDSLGNMHQMSKLVANPLDHMAALEKFEAIVKIHGHYDEPWQHMFQFSMGGQQIQMPHQEFDQSEMEEVSGLQTQLGDAFDIGYEHFDSMADIHGDFS